MTITIRLSTADVTALKRINEQALIAARKQVAS